MFILFDLESKYYVVLELGKARFLCWTRPLNWRTIGPNFPLSAFEAELSILST